MVGNPEEPISQTQYIVNSIFLHCREMDDLMTLLTATLHMDQDNGREEEMLPRDFANSHISGKHCHN